MLSAPQSPHTAPTEPMGASELSLSAFIELSGSLKLTTVRGIYTTDIGKHLYGIPLVIRQGKKILLSLSLCVSVVPPLPHRGM